METMRLLKRIHSLVQEGFLDKAKRTLQRAEKKGTFHVRETLPTRIREEQMRANQIFFNSTKRALTPIPPPVCRKSGI
jgi:hypothetical protein